MVPVDQKEKQSKVIRGKIVLVAVDVAMKNYQQRRQ